MLDIHLNGGMSGFDLQARLTADRVLSRSSSSPPMTMSIRERIEGSGAAGYLAKPVDGQALLDVIGKVVGSA